MASILLVEDNDDHAILAHAALSVSNGIFQVDRATSADECLDMLDGKNYDAIVLDYSLPKRSGLELLQEIGEASYDAPVVMITSHGDEKIAVEAMKSGAYDYVSKVDDYLTKLPLVLQKAIEAHDMARERAELQAKIEDSENRLRNIFENVDVGVVEVGSNYNVSYANPKARHYLGITDNSSDLDIRPIFSQPIDGKQECKNNIAADCFREGISVNCEINYNDKQFSVAITPISGSDTNVSHLVVILMDITDQKRLRQQLIQSERIRVLGRMASGIAHDFNNVLAAILGRVELMLMAPSDRSELEQGLRVIQNAGLSGAETVKRLQEFTRVAKEKEFTAIKVNDVVRGTVSITEPSWKDQTQRDGVRIDMSTELNSNHSILGNAPALRESLASMVFNAIEAMPNGGTLGIKTYDDDGKAYISISDTGIGISPDIIDSIFEPFFTTKGVGYAGLSLSVAYGIISRHEGEINVESAEGGTTFTISLNAHIEDSQSSEGPAALVEPGKANVLIIDDERDIRELLANILSRFNHNVVTASNGMEGVEAFENGNFDVVFTDLGMPNMSGWEVADKISSINPDIMVILVTGWGVELDNNELSERNVDAVISKPFQIKQITDSVSKALEQRMG